MLSIVCSFAACEKFGINCYDARHANFNGIQLDHVLFLWPPKGGLPGERDDDIIITFVRRIVTYSDYDACDNNAFRLVACPGFERERERVFVVPAQRRQ